MTTTDRTRTHTRDTVSPSGLTAPRRDGLSGGAMVAGVLVAVLLGWYAAPLVYPLRLLTVLLHEGGHALVALATGGTLVELRVNMEESGHTLTTGGIPLLIRNGGYLGALAAGLLLTRAPRASRLPTAALGLIAALALAYIPLLSFGFAYTALVATGLFALAWKGSHAACRFVLRAVGLFVTADSVRDILSDFGRGDALLLRDATGIPAFLWSILWLVLALFVLVQAVRRARG